MTTTVSFAGDEPTKEIPTVLISSSSCIGFRDCGLITPEEYQKVINGGSIFFQEMFWIKLK